MEPQSQIILKITNIEWVESEKIAQIFRFEME